MNFCVLTLLPTSALVPAFIMLVNSFKIPPAFVSCFEYHALVYKEDGERDNEEMFLYSKRVYRVFDLEWCSITEIERFFNTAIRF